MTANESNMVAEKRDLSIQSVFLVLEWRLDVHVLSPPKHPSSKITRTTSFLDKILSNFHLKFNYSIRLIVQEYLTKLSFFHLNSNGVSFRFTRYDKQKYAYTITPEFFVLFLVFLLSLLLHCVGYSFF